MNKLCELIPYITKKHVFIQTHNFPDPDAIASAYGLQYILLQKGIQSTICYKGNISHTTSSKMVSLLGIDIVELRGSKDEELTQLFDDDAEIILVDSQMGNSNTISLPGVHVLCIDHHPTYDAADYECSDIRPDVGACASIIASYFYENNIAMDKNIATALLYGIKIDTANMTRGVSKLDLDMFYKIYPDTDKNILSHLDTSVLRIKDLKAYANAIASIRVINNICFTNAGIECPEQLIATISDFILELEEVNLAVVCSQKKDGIKLSVRCSNRNWNIGRLTNEVLKEIGNGGGHEQMAGGFVPYDFVNEQIKNGAHMSIEELYGLIEKRFVEQTYLMKRQ